MPQDSAKIALSDLKAYFQKNKEAILNDYYTFLRFQSISTDPAYSQQVLACAEWVRDYLKESGFDVEYWQTSGYPVIFASHLKAGKDKPTLLIYNHYDVQPVDPLSEWTTPPFEPSLRNGEVYARGAQDNKGQCFYTMLALRHLLKHYKTLPVNIKLCIEGEEEFGSAGIAGILPQKKEALKADYLAIVDVGIRGPELPSITLGTRGMVSMDVEVEGSLSDMHSGCHGGLAYNPIRALSEILSSLRDSKGKITISGFYEDVIGLSDEEKELICWEFDEETYVEQFGISPTGGETNLTPSERAWLRPTLEINGMWGGYIGQGFKTVIPSKAYAKISCRLVPNQDPKKIGALVANAMEQKAPPGIKVKVNVHSGGGVAVRAKADSKIVEAFAKAYTEVFDKPCEYIYEGATIPIAPALSHASQSEVVLVGLGLIDDQIHAPNEHFGVDRIERGFFIIVRTIENLGVFSPS